MTTKLVAGLIISAALVISPVAASAAEPQGNSVGKAVAQETGSGKADSVQEKKICKQLPSSSSRLPQRVCLTKRQWLQVEQEAWLR